MTTQTNNVPLSFEERQQLHDLTVRTCRRAQATRLRILLQLQRLAQLRHAQQKLIQAEDQEAGSEGKAGSARGVQVAKQQLERLVTADLPRVDTFADAAAVAIADHDEGSLPREAATSGEAQAVAPQMVNTSASATEDGVTSPPSTTPLQEVPATSAPLSQAEPEPVAPRPPQRGGRKGDTKRRHAEGTSGSNGANTRPTVRTESSEEPQ